MNTNRWMGFAAMSVLMVGMLAVLVPTSPGQAPAAKPVVNWEYKTYFFQGNAAQNLDEFGHQGWELVGFTRHRRDENEIMYVFKRPH